jgi:lysyl-tRNA synthetase class 1
MKIKEKSWPFTEAMRVVKEIERREYSDPILFETGFGPSGLPHIGTFAEVARTTFVKNAFEHLTGRQGEIYVYCDDMDGLRKVPGNVPESEMLAENLGKPICRIPDPFGCCDSYSGHMINKLVEFLDTYGFVFTLKKSSEEYAKGTFNETLHKLMEKTDGVKNIILPTLKEETRKNWSPFFPVCENCGSINATQVTGYFPEEDMVAYECTQANDKNPAC